VLGQLAGQQEADGRLDFATGDRRTTVVVGETGRLGGDALEDVVDEAVHDRHGLAADARVGVDLLEHLVDVDGVRLSSSPLALLVSGADGLRLAGGLLRSFASWLRWHGEKNENDDSRSTAGYIGARATRRPRDRIGTSLPRDGIRASAPRDRTRGASVAWA